MSKSRPTIELDKTSGGENDWQLYMRLLRYIVPYLYIFAVSVVGYAIYSGGSVMFADLMQFLIDALNDSDTADNGIVAGMAHDEAVDNDLVSLDASHLFASSVTKIGCRRGTFLRGYMYEFIEDFAPHLTRDVVSEAFKKHTRAELEELFSHLELPVY